MPKLRQVLQIGVIKNLQKELLLGTGGIQKELLLGTGGMADSSNLPSHLSWSRIFSLHMEIGSYTWMAKNHPAPKINRPGMKCPARIE